MSPLDAPVATASESLLARVRKLLAMAEGSANQHEADAFSRKAAELIAAHRISPDQLRAVDVGGLRVLSVRIGRGAYVRGRLALLQAIADAHGCETVFEARQAGTVALVAGFGTDLDLVELLYNSLHTQAAARMAAERRPTPAATQRWRRSFLFGYAAEIATMLRRSADAAVAAEPSSGAALPALRARRQRVREFSRDEFGRVVAARRPKAALAVGFEAGQHAARRADIGRTRLPGRRAIGAGS